MLNFDFVTNSVMNSRTYILSDDDAQDVWLVDCGDINKVYERIGEKRITGVLLTHSHSDHIYGLPELIRRFPEVKIYTNEFGKQALKDPKLNLSRFHEEYDDLVIDNDDNVIVVKEGDKLTVLDNEFSVIETPGHDPSCLCYLCNTKSQDEKSITYVSDTILIDFNHLCVRHNSDRFHPLDGFIFTGDSYIPGIKVFTGFPKGNKSQAMESKKRIKALAQNKIILPGHSEVCEV